MKITVTKWMIGLVLSAAVLSCGKDDDNTVNPGEDNGRKDKYFIAAVQGEGTYMLTVDDLEKDTTISTIGNGIEKPVSYTHYAYNGTTAVMAINYQQGNPAVGAIFQLNAQSTLQESGNGFELTDGFSTLGAFGDYILTSRSGRTLSSGQTGAALYFIDLANNNNITEKYLVTENLAGNGLTAELLGIVDAGNGEFLTGLNLTNGSPDSVYVARLDADLNVKNIYKDNRISFSGGQWKSARYSQIANDGDGNTYVFSGRASATTTKSAGALLIKKGESNFDASYYFDIQAQSGVRFRKVWAITEDYFLLELYNSEAGFSAQSTAATQYGIARMSTKEFKFISGIPDKDVISNTGWPFTTDGKAYLPITTASAQPAVYVIDPVTATAKKGVTVNGAASIGGLARLSPQAN